MMNVQYKNLIGNIITAPQVKGFYDREYLQNDGQVKISERMFGPNIKGEVIFYRGTEGINQIVSQYNSIPGVEMLFIRARESYGKYTLINETSYFRDEITGNLELEPYQVKMINNPEGFTISSESINPSVPMGEEGHRGIGKVYYLGDYANNTDYSIPDLHIFFTPKGLFDYAIYNPKMYMDAMGIYEDQDIEYLNLAEVMDMLNGLSQAMKDWYVNDVFLPPI